jgi:hypothetical protein
MSSHGAVVAAVFSSGKVTVVFTPILTVVPLKETEWK